MKILLDMDGVVADLMTPWLKAWNEKYVSERYPCRPITVEDCKAYDWMNLLGVNRDFAMELISGPGFFLNAVLPYDGAVAGVRALQEIGEVFFVTKPVQESPTCYHDKVRWAWYVFGMDRKRVIACYRKEMINGDVLVDDDPENLKDFPGVRILWHRPWNTYCHSPEVFVVSTWDGVRSIVEELKREQIAEDLFSQHANAEDVGPTSEHESGSAGGPAGRARPEGPGRVFSDKGEYIGDKPMLLEDANYFSLKKILDLAYERASSGKGKERHATGEPFEQQPICSDQRALETTAPVLFQIRKKALESSRMPPGRAIKELLDVMVYAAAGVIYLQEQEKANG